MKYRKGLGNTKERSKIGHNGGGTSMSDSIRVGVDTLHQYCASLFIAEGVSPEDARLIVDNLIDADLAGVESHGVSRVAIYLKRLRSGVVSPTMKLEVVKDFPATCVLDGGNCMGVLAGVKAMDLAIEKAKKVGVSWVVVRNSNHYGRAAYYTERAVPHGMIGFSATNGSPRMAPWGAREAYFGTNPFSIAVPTGQELAIVADLATSVVARGKITLAAKNGKDIPLGWAIDKDGHATTNAKAALDGTVLPVGGPKGSAIALMIDVLTGTLSGSLFGVHLPDMVANFSEPAQVSHFFAAIDIEKFTDVTEFKQNMARMATEIKALRTAQGVNEILLPGEVEFNMKRERLVDGIPLNLRLLRELREEGQKYGIPFFTEV